MRVAIWSLEFGPDSYRIGVLDPAYSGGGAV